MLTISPVKTKKDYKNFVQFPYDLYKNCEQWIPPLFQDELYTFNPKKNPVFEHASASLFLVYENNEIVGRVAVIINRQEIENQGIEKVRFGFLDAVDDEEVFKLLLDKVEEIGKANHLKYLEGPMGFSNLDKVGALIDGFEQEGNMTTWYNFPYYIKHFKALGLVPEKTFVESKFPFSKVNAGEKFERAAKIISEKYKVRLIKFTNTNDILPYINQMFQLFNESYAKLSSFVAVSPSQIDYLKKKYIPMINPEYIKFVLDKDEKMIAFSIVMPSLSKGLKKSKGKLFPFGFYHLLKAKNNSKDILFYLIGINPDYLNKGITALIFDDYIKIFTKNKIENCIRTPELLENDAIHNNFKNFDDGSNLRHRQTFKKII
jgi:hypothetical protein